MAATLRWSGLDELKAQLRNLPTELTTEASRIVDATANAAAVEVRTAYGRHHVTGDLQSGVVVTHTQGGKWSAGAILKSSSPHAWLFDNGSQARHYFSKNGKEHKTGKMWGRIPPTHVFVRTAVNARRVMYGKFKDMLVRNGLIVTGEP
jgi:hypothetical protein